jgi:hypothetical protein
MPARPDMPADALHGVNATINTMMSQAITDHDFGQLLEGAIIWEDSDDLVPVADEARSLDELTPEAHHDPEPAETPQDHHHDDD